MMALLPNVKIKKGFFYSSFLPLEINAYIWAFYMDIGTIDTKRGKQWALKKLS